MTKEQAEKEWLQLNRMLRELRILKLGSTGMFTRHYALCIHELESAQKLLVPIIDPE